MKNQVSNQLVKNMVEKYCEIYQRALEAGHNEKEAHVLVAEFFNKGFKYLEEVKA